MFIVFNKEKIYSYIVALSTIVVLFMIANIVIDRNQDLVQALSSEKLLPIYSVDTDEKKVAFTMNCAWNADDIDSILDTLSKNKIHITFFIVGEWTDKYPEYVKKISEAGHEIANHSNTHPHVNNLGLSQNAEEIRLVCEKIEKITGKATTLYRSPYGEYNNTVINAATEQKHFSIQWNLDTLDYTRINRKTNVG
jgi:peptidoglycan/xylan/chitin deacetylase (PgdA/CDA1 family)